MDLTRRRLLLATSSVSFPALAGCTGLTESSNGGDGSNGGGGGSGGGGGNGGEETATETGTETETATPEPTDPFLLRTREIMDQIAWFGSQYQSARRNYLLKLRPVVGTIETLRSRNTLAEADVAELTSKTTALATYVNEELAPYFDLERRLTNGENDLVRNFASAVEQNDTRASQDALSRLAVFYNRAGTESYLNQNLSAHPIEEPLHEMLSSVDVTKVIFGLSYPPGDNFTTQTFSDEIDDEDADDNDENREKDEVRPHSHTFPSGQTIYAHAHVYDSGHDIYSHENEPPNGRVYAFSDGSIDIMKDTEAWRERLADYEAEYTNIFDAVVIRDGRVDYAYVMANELVTDVEKEEQFEGRPILIQRFQSESAAATAMDTLLETTLGSAGTTTLADREWTKVFYDYDGPNLYGNVYQIGEFVITTSVSQQPHSQRGPKDQWPSQLKSSWLGMETSNDSGN